MIGQKVKIIFSIMKLERNRNRVFKNARKSNEDASLRYLNEEKLRLEVKNLARPWWKTQLSAVVTLIIGLASAFVACNQGVFDAERSRLEAEKSLLSLEVKEFQIQKMEYTDSISYLKDSLASTKGMLSYASDSLYNLAVMLSKLRKSGISDTIMIETILEKQAYGSSLERMFRDALYFDPTIYGKCYNCDLPIDLFRKMHRIYEYTPSKGLFYINECMSAVFAPTNAEVDFIGTEYLVLRNGDLKFLYKGVEVKGLKVGDLVKRGDCVASATFDDRFSAFTFGYGVMKLNSRNEWRATGALEYINIIDLLSPY